MGLPDSSQHITIVIYGVMMAIRWLEAHIKQNHRQEAPTQEQLEELDCLKDFLSVQNVEHSDGSKEDMGQETTDEMVQSQHDCMVVQICQKAHVEVQQSVQCVSAGHWIGSFQARFRNASECSDYSSEKNVQNT